MIMREIKHKFLYIYFFCIYVESLVVRPKVNLTCILTMTLLL